MCVCKVLRLRELHQEQAHLFHAHTIAKHGSVDQVLKCLKLLCFCFQHFSLLLMPVAPLLLRARDSARRRVRQREATLVPGTKFMVRLRAVASGRVEGDLDQVWRTNNNLRR